MHPSRTGTVALVVGRRIAFDGKQIDDSPILIEKFSDNHEIEIFESAVESGEVSPLGMIYQLRDRKKVEEEEFGNYVEELLSQPFLKSEVQKHGLEWLQSKHKIEQFQKTEREATEIIAQYAYRVYLEDPKRVDFILSGPSAKVRIRVFELKIQEALSEAA
jgi:hypothetical protein